MKTIPYVLPEEAALARYIETKLLNAPLEAGIQFVGVKVGVSFDTDTKGQHRVTDYDIHVGVDREVIQDVKIVDMLVQSLLKLELDKNSHLSIHAFRGRSKKALDSSPAPDIRCVY